MSARGWCGASLPQLIRARGARNDMTTGHESLVSVGLPVCNGERYLASAIDSHLEQTFGDFELVISDNGSSDGTRDICERYARLDGRIRYHREDSNRGLTWNHRRVLELSRGTYFRWGAADDLPTPTMIGRFVAILEQDPSIVLCVPATKNIDADGVVTATLPNVLNLTGDDPVERARAILLRKYQFVFPQGLMRRATLDSMRIRWDFFGWDMIVLFQFALLGKIVQPDDAWLLRRLHAAQATRLQRSARAGREVEPTFARKAVFPHWRWQLERLRVAASTAGLRPSHRLRVIAMLARHGWWTRAALVREVGVACRRSLGLTDEVTL